MLAVSLLDGRSFSISGICNVIKETDTNLATLFESMEDLKIVNVRTQEVSSYVCVGMNFAGS